MTEPQSGSDQIQLVDRQLTVKHGFLTTREVSDQPGRSTRVPIFKAIGGRKSFDD